MKNKKYGKKRVWLNSAQDELACIAWSVEKQQYSKKGIHQPQLDNIDATITIRDCSRAVTLEFYGGTDEYKEKLKKINKLEKEVVAFKAALISAMENE